MTQTADFKPPQAAASLYSGPVMHARMKPVSHRFTYQVFSLLIDVDRLEEANRLSPVFSVSRWNLLSFSPSDHGPRDGTPLRAHVSRLLANCGLEIEGGRVLLFCYPRVLGFVFNPLSIYYCYDRRTGSQRSSTRCATRSGESHSYVAPVKPQEAAESGVRQERDKLFYVSPFLDMTMRYHFRLHAARRHAESPHSRNRCGRPDPGRDVFRRALRHAHRRAAQGVLRHAAADVQDRRRPYIRRRCGFG